ncbi:MAG: DUF4296 domain-containing protein [Saprospiraceae bacterium]
MSINRIPSLFFILLVTGLGLSSCSDPNPQLPLHDEDIRILTDIMLLEGVLQDFAGEGKDSVANANYNIIYDRHGISEQDLQKLRKRYSDDPSLWSRTADSIEARLKRGRTDFETLLNPELN